MSKKSRRTARRAMRVSRGGNVGSIQIAPPNAVSFGGRGAGGGKARRRAMRRGATGGAKNERAPFDPARAAFRADQKAKRRARKKEEKARKRAALGGAALNAAGGLFAQTDFGQGVADFTGLDLSKLGDTASSLYLGAQGYGSAGASVGTPGFGGDVYGPPAPPVVEAGVGGGMFDWFTNASMPVKLGVGAGAAFLGYKLLKS